MRSAGSSASVTARWCCRAGSSAAPGWNSTNVDIRALANAAGGFGDGAPRPGGGREGRQPGGRWRATTATASAVVARNAGGDGAQADGRDAHTRPVGRTAEACRPRQGRRTARTVPTLAASQGQGAAGAGSPRRSHARQPPAARGPFAERCQPARSMKTSLGYIGADSFSRQRKEQRSGQRRGGPSGGNFGGQGGQGGGRRRGR